MILASAILAGAAPPGAAMVNTCVPDTLGSEAFRRHQVFEYVRGAVVQPLNGGVCLTATDEYSVQPVRAHRGQGWGLVMAPCTTAAGVNQSWELSGSGQLLLTSLNLCVDVAGYGSAPRSLAHLWPCTEVPAGGSACPATARCPDPNCT